jgi:hypothetical protein
MNDGTYRPGPYVATRAGRDPAFNLGDGDARFGLETSRSFGSSAHAAGASGPYGLSSFLSLTAGHAHRDSPSRRRPPARASLERVTSGPSRRRENLLKQWESMSPAQRDARLTELAAERVYWEERERWVQAQVEDGGYDVEWLASGGVTVYESS